MQRVLFHDRYAHAGRQMANGGLAHGDRRVLEGRVPLRFSPVGNFPALFVPFPIVNAGKRHRRGRALPAFVGTQYHFAAVFTLYAHFP